MAPLTRKGFIVAALVFVAAIASCKRATVSVPQNQDTTLVLFVGGFAHDQLDDVYSHFQEAYPTYSLVRFAPEDGYKTDVAGYVAKSKYGRLILVAHSWGNARCVADAAAIPHVDCLIMYDPVAFDQGSLTLPASVARAIVFPRMQSKGILPFTASISGANVISFPMPGEHSDGCHNSDSFRIIDEQLKL